MKSPFDTLEVAANASDAEIKQAYLRKVKGYPPDRDRAQFQAVHTAYESIKDHKSRIAYALFHVPDADFDALLDRALATKQGLKINPEQFMQLLQAGADETALLNATAHAEQS